MIPTDYRSWFEKNYPWLSGHGLWLRGGELNTVPAGEWDNRAFRILITRLSTYRDTADSFTHTLLYQIASRIEGVYPDLAWLPPPKDASVFDRDSVPWLLGATSKRGAREFDVVALSNAIVQEIVNIPAMLHKSGIPVSKRTRMADPSLPLIIMGGASALHASILFSSDPPVDGIFIGEDAATIARLFRLCREFKAAGHPKAALLAALEDIPGFISPDGEGTTTVFHAPLPGHEQLLEAGPILTYEGTLGRGNLQISEGCACFCSFCAESFSRKPYREFSVETVHEQALLQKAFMGVSDMELYSFNFNMHRDFYRILRDLAVIFPTLGLKSQRFDSIAEDPQLINYLHAVDKTSITCGLEGISGRLRRYLHKSLDDKELKKGLLALLSAPLRELKVFLIATGLEETADFDEFRELLRYIETVAHSAGRRPRILFSMTALVRFPWTPLEFEEAPLQNACLDILRRTERAVKGAGFEFRASADAADYWLSQVLVRAADPAIAIALWRAQESSGFVYYREIPAAFIHAFRHELSKLGMDPDSLLKGSSPLERGTKPWRRINTGVDESFLVRQWMHAKEFKDMGYCAGTLSRSGTCIGCNGCRDGDEKTRILGRLDAVRDYRVDQLKGLRQKAAAEQVPLYFKVTTGPASRGMPRTALGIALARALMLTERRLAQGYRGFYGSLVFDTFKSNWVAGDDIVTLLWNIHDRPRIETLYKDPVFVEKANRLMDTYGTVTGLIESNIAAMAALSFESPFQFDPDPYCNDKAIKYIQRKTGDGGYYCELSKDSLKKKLFSSMILSAGTHGNGFFVTIKDPGPKFNPEEFARKAFKVPTEEDWVRIVISVKFITLNAIS